MIGGHVKLVRQVAAMLAGTVLFLPQQQPPPAPQPPQQQQPTFRVRIDTVSVDVIVTDRQGNPITDLTVDDFEVREAGKVQKIDTFKFIQIDDSQDASPPRELMSFEDQRRETAREDNRLLVILLDDYHVRRGNSMRIRQELATFVSRLAPRDLVAIMYPLTPATAITFGRNHDATASELMGFEGRKYDYTPRNAVEARYQMLAPEVQEQIRNQASMTALETVSMYLGSLREGRKTVLFVSEGFSSSVPPGVRTRGSIFSPSPMNQTTQQSMTAVSDLHTQMRDVFIQATRSNTAIYTLDPRGLATSEFGIEDTVDSSADRNSLNEAIDSLRSIAEETQGRAIVGRNNPLPELDRMRRDMSHYYLMSYTSTIAPRDGKFHQIDVRLKTRRGLDVRARKGYWAYSAADYERAIAPPKPAPPRDITNALEDLAGAVTPSARRPALLYVGARRGTGDKAIVTFVWEATGGPPTPGTEAPDRVSIVAHSIQGDLLFKGPVPRDSAGLPGGHVTFEAPPGSVRVQTVTENARGSRIDSDQITLDIPDFATSDISISTPLLYRGRTVRDIQQLRAAASSTPTASRVFSRTERLLLRFEVYAPAEQTPTVTMRILNNQGDQLAALPPPPKSSAGYESEFALGSFPPGEYLLEITAEAAGKSKRQLFAIRVSG